MAKALIVGSDNIRHELRGSVLFGRGTETLFAADLNSAIQTALAEQPNLVLIDAAHIVTAVVLIRRLRDAPKTHHCSVVAVSRWASHADESVLRHAGANLVLSTPVDADRWDARLERLLSVPPRRAMRLPVRLEFWSGEVAGAEPMSGTALNISVHGLLLETDAPLDLGSRLDLAFALPDRAGELRALGCVVREAECDGRAQSGIEFLILHGDAQARVGAFVAAQRTEGNH